MAYLCPELCRPSCGGKCATPTTCPSGFNIENGVLIPYDPSLIEANPYPYYCKCVFRAVRTVRCLIVGKISSLSFCICFTMLTGAPTWGQVCEWFPNPGVRNATPPTPSPVTPPAGPPPTLSPVTPRPTPAPYMAPTPAPVGTNNGGKQTGGCLIPAIFGGC